MKVVKYILIIFTSLVLLFFITALFLPGEYSVERSIKIRKPAPVVFQQVADYNNYQKWSPWAGKDPEAKNLVTGVPGEVGTKWSWEGRKIGSGSLTIEEIIPSEKIRSRLEFIEPQPMEAEDLWKFFSLDGSTEVSWSNSGELDYPVGRYVGLFMDKILGPEFESGLAMLKHLSESLPDTLERQEEPINILR